MPRVGFQPAIPTTKRPQIYALDRAAPGIGVAYMPVYRCSPQRRKGFHSRVGLFPNHVTGRIKRLRDAHASRGLLTPC
jgi:hypothetical protein